MTKTKVSPPIDLKELTNEVSAFCQNGATVAEIDFFIKEFEEMKEMLENAKKKGQLPKQLP